MNDKQKFAETFKAVDPNLGSQVEALLEGTSLQIAKLRIRAAVSSVVVSNRDTESIRDDLVDILTTVAAEGLDGPRDLDVALDAIMQTFGAE